MYRSQFVSNRVRIIQRKQDVVDHRVSCRRASVQRQRTVQNDEKSEVRQRAIKVKDSEEEHSRSSLRTCKEQYKIHSTFFSLNSK